MVFAQHIVLFFEGLKKDWVLPSEVELIFPFDDPKVMNLVSTFYQKYYSDKNDRHFLFGINPGRFGAGQTGIPFTDPILLQQACGIANELDKKHELSSIFVYEMIDMFDGPDAFYSQFYISSLCPLGFIKDGRNYNYYDSKELYQAVESYMVEAIDSQIERFCKMDKAFSLGQGKNFKIFQALNDRHGWFSEVIPLPHPRWVMQYRRKYKQTYLEEYLQKLSP